jgi:crossover junction endodeoxyribonuclease RusA
MTVPAASQFSSYHYVLPFPPSVNHYWRTRRQGFRQITYVSKQGVAFQKAVAKVVHQRPNTRRRLAVTMQLQRGDAQEYDIDNYVKSTLDALQKAGVFMNDRQVDRLVIERLPYGKVGLCNVTVEEIGHAKSRFSVKG